MNRLFITILSFCLLVSVFAQKPSQGSLATEAQMNLNNKVSFFPFDASDNLLLPTLRFRYFLKDDIALRGDLNLMNSSSTNNFTENFDGSGATGEFVTKQNTFGLGLGVEKHFGGNARFSPFVGGGLSFATGSFTQEGTQSDGNTYVMDYSSTSTNKVSIFGVQAFLGADYWINNSFYLGGQFGLGLNSVNIQDGDFEEVNGGVPTSISTLGGTSMDFGNIVTPSIRVGFLFIGSSSAGDADGDGVADAVDKCPNTPKGMKVGPNGCPKVVMDVQLLAKNIYFETASDVIKSESFASLDKVASILVANPMANLSIEGHTDNQGDANMNMDLSKRRAQSVLNYLSKKGVDVTHLKAVGFGETKPLADNDTDEGRALNRRVELLLSF